MINSDFELKKALNESVDNEFSKISQENEIEWDFSEKFEKQTKKLLKTQKKGYWKIINTASKRVALFVLVAVLFMGGLFSFRSVRAATADAFKTVITKTKNILKISDEKATDVLGTASDGSFKHTEFNYDLPETEVEEGAPAVQNETFDDPKTQVYNKMLNSIDYFNKIEMTIETSMLYEGNSVVEYYSDIEAARAYEAVYKDGILILEDYCDGETMYEINNNTKLYEKSHTMIFRREDAPYIPLKDRVFTETDGIPAYRYRRNITNCPLASLGLYSQELIYSYLGDFERWQIEDENAEFFGRDCIKLSGTTAPYTADKHNNDSFTMLVDKKTGIILKFEAYKGGKVTQYITTTKFIVDKNPTIKSFDDERYKDYKEIQR